MESKIYSLQDSNDLQNITGVIRKPPKVKIYYTIADDVKKEQLRLDSDILLDEIQIKKLCKTHEDQIEAIKRISFGVEKNMIFGLVGPKNAGRY